ncbi:MAG: polyribonucleotide nucleotidyltransferase [Armatimonadota bacterium]|nr:polyribonucleotide nucleotidyltransferase [Armatimonadota bacterium]MDR7421733.1 polyribonucleotide nucleotidyltransferase [Armatimonadota bacterium]MDR7453714.1 polyribonucleotide nucleotidyltransferase [Armatimonadota bacterium]MDR7456411.1 polyribonucleotide nucleotidyltransferase [Armatimonadota bacterium]MDR7497807.1 polyribonucleotide nucleotidyltransferase [Armatimonadota bacterium]
MVRRAEAAVGGARLVFETGLLARQAHGAVTVTMGETVVLVTATMSDAPREGIDFFPLTCDFEERMYAAGKIPGGFFKREGRPGERAILTSRLIDRPMRPLFPKGMRNDVQVIATVLSTDQAHDPGLAAMNGASAALMISGIPFGGPVGAVRIGLLDDRLVVNPTMREVEEESRLDLVVAGTDTAILMVEAGADEVPEARLLDAIDLAHAEIKKIVAAQRELVAAAGHPPRPIVSVVPDPALAAAVREAALPLVREALRAPEKAAREDALRAVEAEVREKLDPTLAGAPQLGDVIAAIVKEEVRRRILDEGRRPDGRTPTEIRPLACAVGLLPRTHGSGLFQRGQTQVLSVVTLGTSEDKQRVDDIGIREFKRYMHHYVFPPFSVGEVRPLRSPGRRDIGHGALAERAVERLIPPEEQFPYAIRVVSEVLESNGSTSMASVCGSTLALMDAGVPIRAAVGGIAMGLVTDADGRYAILTDIQGIEDAMGDMDFKVAGTREGVTALQMDIKIGGLSRAVLGEALEQARAARMRVLDAMAQAIAAPRTVLSPHAPRILTIQINPERIRDVIGPGGKVINKITAETGTKIDIEQDGRVMIASVNEEAAARAAQMIEAIVHEVQVGETYRGRVTRLLNFGAFVEILPGKEGLVHISELSYDHVNKVEDVVKVGDELEVKVKEIDSMGRINLTHRGTQPPPEGWNPEYEERQPADITSRRPLHPRREGGRRDGGRPPRRRGGPRPARRPQ